VDTFLPSFQSQLFKLIAVLSLYGEYMVQMNSKLQRLIYVSSYFELYLLDVTKVSEEILLQKNHFKGHRILFGHYAY